MLTISEATLLYKLACICNSKPKRLHLSWWRGFFLRKLNVFCKLNLSYKHLLYDFQLLQINWVLFYILLLFRDGVCLFVDMRIKRAAYSFGLAFGMWLWGPS